MSRIEPFSIFCDLPTLTAAQAVFPQMQRIASIAVGFSGSARIWSIPYWLKGIVFDTSLITANQKIGVAVVVGQNGRPFVAYSQDLCVPVCHAAYPATANSLTVDWDCPEPGIYIPANTEIALYGFYGAGGGAGDHIWASAALQMEQA